MILYYLGNFEQLPYWFKNTFCVFMNEKYFCDKVQQIGLQFWWFTCKKSDYFLLPQKFWATSLWVKKKIFCLYALKIAGWIRRRWQKGSANRLKNLVVVTYTEWLFSITWKFLSNFPMGLKTQFCVFMNEKYFCNEVQQIGLKFWWLLRNETNYFLLPQAFGATFLWV